MSPLSSSSSPPNQQSSSTSTSPPTETSLNEQEDVPEAMPSLSWSQFNIPDTNTEQPCKEQPMDRQQRSQILNAINTDYESSAAEDFESFTSSKYENAEFALLSYARTNKLEKLQVLLESKLRNEISLDLNFKGQQKQNFSWSALHLACYFGHITVVELLLSKKQYRDEIDINIQNNSGDTPLHKATLTNRAEIVQLLLSKDANVFIKNCDGLLAKHLTKDKHILNMLEATELVDKNRAVQAMFKSVDNGDLKKLQEYFENYDCHAQVSRTNEENVDYNDPSAELPDKNTGSDRFGEGGADCEPVSGMTDGRGNTLLHLAAMRGFKAICVYLLEQGCDPYRKNHLGQSPIDLSSYQLRQLFSTVKPANSQLKKLSGQRVSRFEGPLLKKVRILGWRQIYVVLENGVILLFNNRRDSMNKSRRGYKYLESAICEPDTNDLGTFTVSFSDRSRVTFLVTSDHLNNYTSYKTSSVDHDRGISSINQIELVRQKWIDSIRDHIRYSTDFIKNGLKLNDHDDEHDAYNDGDLSSLNHLLPVDTIKSFMQEARAHYSILERHADSLCNLIQSINSSNRVKQSIESSTREEEIQNIDPAPVVTSSTTTGSRLFSLIRPSRQARGNSVSGDDAVSLNQQQLAASSNRKRNDSLTNEFLQDNWHCILFHLRLLMESTENTKVSMGQALGLIEHQEQLRQNRIQEQEERCRVLEDSLHALARDHHELEKSLSMSQIFHSAAVRSLSMSMSTDLNEYFDAFEDFDDANSRTLTPTSMPTDEDLNQRIQEVIDESGPKQSQFSGELSLPTCEATDDDEEEEDLRSNCSALTVETVSDSSVATIENKLNNADIDLINSLANIGGNKPRTRLPSPMVPRDQVSIWSILKNCIGKELSKITMPVVFNEPLTMLQRACECVQFSRYLKMADESNDPVERMEMICTFIVASLSANCHRIIKPFNPLLYETYEYDHELEDGSHVRALAQQVSHHPPITAAYCESENFIYNGSVNPKIKFWGRSIEIQPDGRCRIFLKRHKETYVFKSVTCSVHNIIVGKLWFEHKGPLEVRCVETNVQANLNFKQAGWFSNDLHRFDGHIVSSVGGKGMKVRFVYGKWSDYIKSVEYSEYENYMKNSQQKLFIIPDNPYQGQSNGLGYGTHGSPNSINNNIPSAVQQGDAVGSSSEANTRARAGEKKAGLSKSESAQSLDIPNSRTLWRLESQYLEEYYNFTLFTMKLNELSNELAKTLPKTDSRFRLDVRKLEEGDLDGAASEKQRLEEKQREVRAKDKRFKDPSPDMLWFDLNDVKPTKEKFWIYKGGYWESKCNPEKFPELF